MLVVLAEVDCRAYLNSHNIYPNEFFTDLDDLKQHMPFYTDVDLIILFTGMVQFHKRKVSEYIHLIREEQEENRSNVLNLCIVSDTTLPKVDGYYKYTLEPIRAKLHNGWDKVKGKGFENPLLPFEGPTIECNTHMIFEHRTLQISEVSKKETELLKLIQVPDVKKLVAESTRLKGLKKIEREA